MKVTMASDASTLRCPGCASAVAPGAAWCGLCFSPMPVASAFTAAPAAPAGPPGDASRGFRPAGFRPEGLPPEGLPPGGFRPGGAAPTPAKIFTDSRWKSGSLTFGPVGRVILTILSVLPYPLFIVNLPFGLVGIVIWTGLMPRILRDIWRPARRHHLPPEPQP